MRECCFVMLCVASLCSVVHCFALLRFALICFCAQLGLVYEKLLLNAGVSRSRTALTRTSVCCTMASVCRPAPSDNKVGCAAPPGSDVGCAAPSEAKAGCAALLVLPCCNRRARSRSVERKTRHVIYEPKAASHSSRTRPPCERGKIPLCFMLPLLGSHIYYFWLALEL